MRGTSQCGDKIVSEVVVHGKSRYEVAGSLQKQEERKQYESSLRGPFICHRLVIHARESIRASQ